MNREAEILHEASSVAGIDAVGVSNLLELDRFRNKFSLNKDRKAAFYRGELKEKFDYHSIWNETKSIISFAVGYYSDVEEPNDGKLRGKISRCAWGEDYHVVLRRKADLFINELKKSFGDFQSVIMIDNGVISDRACAYAAGIGFYGKNGFIINPRFGSYLFLGTILIDIQLKENERLLPQQCGTCDLCLDSCPNQALSEAFGFDYEKCISYQTQKGMDTDTKGWIYGCDICQQLCKFNRKIESGLHREFDTEPQLAYPDIIELSKIGREQFDQRYATSSLNWKGYRMIKKNCEQMMYRLNHDNTHKGE